VAKESRVKEERKVKVGGIRKEFVGKGEVEGRI